jgi:hypothetical protein
MNTINPRKHTRNHAVKVELAGPPIEQRNVVVERPILGQSLVSPECINDTIAQDGTTEYITRLGTRRGRGPKVYVKQMRKLWKGKAWQVHFVEMTFR